MLSYHVGQTKIQTRKQKQKALRIVTLYVVTKILAVATITFNGYSICNVSIEVGLFQLILCYNYSCIQCCQIVWNNTNQDTFQIHKKQNFYYLTLLFLL